MIEIKILTEAICNIQKNNIFKSVFFGNEVVFFNDISLISGSGGGCCYFF